MAGRAGGAGRAGEAGPAYPAYPALPAFLEPDFETQLELPLLEARWIHELIRVGRNRRRRVSEQVDRRRRRDVRELLGVEDVLQLGDDFAAHRVVDRNPARVAQVDVLARGEV